MKFPSYIIVILLLSLFHLASYGQDIPEPMSPPRLVNDFANIFTFSQRQSLEEMLRSYNDSTSTQIYVVAVSDLDGYDVSDYAIQLGNKWKIGQKSKNNGAVILIKPKNGISRGQIFIATGYGLEAELNDAKIGRIIDEYMLPYFKQDDYYQGSVSAVDAMIKILSGQFLPEPEDKTEFSLYNIPIIIFMSFVAFQFATMMSKGKNKKDYYVRTGSSANHRGDTPPLDDNKNLEKKKNVDSSSSKSFKGGGGGSFGGGGAGRSW